MRRWLIRVLGGITIEEAQQRVGQVVMRAQRQIEEDRLKFRADALSYGRWVFEAAARSVDDAKDEAHFQQWKVSEEGDIIRDLVKNEDARVDGRVTAAIKSLAADFAVSTARLLRRA